MTKKTEVLTGEWCDADSVERTLGISERTVQKWAKEGHLRFKTIQEGSRRFRLYDASDVERLQREGGPPKTDRGPQDEPDFRLAPRSEGGGLVPYAERPQVPPRRNFRFSLRGGAVSASFPAGLDAAGVARARAFLALVSAELSADQESAASETESKVAQTDEARKAGA